MKFLLDKKRLYFTGVYLSFFAFMLCPVIGWELGIFFFKILAILLFGLFLFKGDKKHTIDFEKSVIAAVVILFQILILWRGKLQPEYEIFDIWCSAVLLVMCIAYFACSYIVYDVNKGMIRKWISKNKIILLVITCFALLSVEVINAWFMWDTYAYYTNLMQVARNFNADFSDIYNMYLAGHASLGYTLWLVLFQLIHEGAAAAHIADIVLAGISIFAYYQILRKLLGKRYYDRVLALATIPYAFSPFLLGMVGNINLDSATMYFAVIFIACTLYHYECLELVAAFFCCFTKETAILYYVIYIVVKVLCEYFTKNRFHLLKLMKFGFGNIKNYIYALPPILWIVLNISGGGIGWGNTVQTGFTNTGNNCLGISEYVISMKLKQIFFLNFNWIFWAAIVFGIAVLVVRKIRYRTKADKEVLEKTIPMSAIIVVVIVCGCLYVTWTHARYITPSIPFLYLIATVIMASLMKKEKSFCIWSSLLSALLLMQCFCTIDPVMKNIFREIPVGNGSICSLQVEPNERLSDRADIRDSIVYNRQYVYWQEVLIDVLNKSGYNGSMLIVMPDDVNCENYGYLGTERALWNLEEKRLEYYNASVAYPNNCVWLLSCHVSEAESLWGTILCDGMLYIIPGWSSLDENFIAENDRFTKTIRTQGVINKKDFRAQYMVIDMAYKAPIEDSNYFLSPKQDSSLGLGTNGRQLYLKEEGDVLNVMSDRTHHKLKFLNCQVFIDVKHNMIDSEGTVWVYGDNGTDAQRFRLQKVDDYYMICWGDYALTYDLESNSVKMSEITGSDNQLWLFH